jgi:glyoxylase-like metal-dependent hydrolase (beta-lactamase superfamily II)
MRGRRASELFFRYDLYGLGDRQLGMDCYFWLIRLDSGQVWLVDCGWSRDRGLGSASGRFSHVQIEESDPLELLSSLDVAPSDVEHIIVSHMHLDHTGNLGLFPNATVSVARAELDCWTGPYGELRAIAHSIAPEDVRTIRDLERDGRVRIVDGPNQLAPGIIVTPVGGHSPGQMIIEVATPAGALVLASDAAHYHEEMDHDRPFYIYTDLIEMFEAYALLRRKAAEPDAWVVTGHDPAEMDRFEAVNADCIDLTKPRG